VEDDFNIKYIFFFKFLFRKELDVEKYQQVCTNYENKIDQAMNKLKMPGKSTTFSLLIERK